MADWLVVSLENKISYNASRMRAQQALLDPDEMEALFKEFSTFFLFQTQAKEGLPCRGDQEEWLKSYRSYIVQEKAGDSFPGSRLSAFIASDRDSFYALKTASGKYLIRPKSPAIQVSHHTFSVNVQEGAFYSQIFGEEALSWGIQFVFPFLFEAPDTKEIFKLNDPEKWPTLALFKKWESWIRTHTVPVKFRVGDKKLIAPFRIGKKAMTWAGELPSLKKQGIILI